MQELSVLQINSEGQLKVMETDLQASKVSVFALKEKNKDMGKIYQNIVLPLLMCTWCNKAFYLLEDLHQVMKTQNEELENENARLHGEFCVSGAFFPFHSCIFLFLTTSKYTFLMIKANYWSALA